MPVLTLRDGSAPAHGTANRIHSPGNGMVQRGPEGPQTGLVGLAPEGASQPSRSQTVFR